MNETTPQKAIDIQGSIDLNAPKETSAEIQVTKVPKFEVDTGTDMTVILGAVVTIATLIATKIYTIRTYKANQRGSKSKGVSIALFFNDKSCHLVHALS
jgi:hypothetical protein